VNARRFVGWLWLLSGIPVGVALAIVPMRVVEPVLIAGVILETAHLCSPIALAWSHQAFRGTMSLLKYVLFPLAVFAGALVAPLQWVSGFYFAWNIYHFGTQNFGVLCLWRSPGLWRNEAAIGIVTLTAIGMILPILIHTQRVALFVLGMFSAICAGNVLNQSLGH
jgi:hypothetical protein